MIRNATLQDLEELSNIENICFPSEEACSKEQFKERLTIYPNHFYLLIKDNQIVSFINGFTTNQPNLEDIMYEQPSLHNEQGAWQMIFGVNTLPAYQHQGLASILMRHVISVARSESRKGLVLTCKEVLIPFYSQFGFINEGLSSSVHGNTTWYQMRLKF